jgi:hypothetical protein
LGQPAPEGIDLLRGVVAEARRSQRTPELIQLHVILSAEGTSPDHPLHDYFVGRYGNVLDVIRMAFKQAQALGQLQPSVDPDSAARTLLAVWDGLQVQWLLDRGGVDMPGGLRRYIQSLLTVEL